MAYTWTNGEVITAEKLNQTGGSGGSAFIVTADDDGDGYVDLDKNYQEMRQAYTSGQSLIAKIIFDDNVDYLIPCVSVSGSAIVFCGYCDYFSNIDPSNNVMFVSFTVEPGNVGAYLNWYSVAKV